MCFDKRKFYLFKIGILTSIISSCSKISEEKSRAEKVEKELTAKIENLEKQNQEWIKTGQASNDAFKDANSERKQLEQKVQQLQKDFDKQSTERDTLQKIVNDSAQQIKDLQKDLADLQEFQKNKNLEEMLKQQQEEIDRKVETNIPKVGTVTIDKNEFDDNIKSLKDEIATLKTRLVKVENQKEELQNLLKDDAKSDKITQELNKIQKKLKEDVESIKNTQKGLQQQLDKCSTKQDLENYSKKGDVEDLQKEQEKLQKNFNDLQTDLKEAKKSIIPKLESDIKELQGKIDEIKKIIPTQQPSTYQLNPYPNLF